MKLSDIKPLNEYYIGGLVPPNLSEIETLLKSAEQQRHHIVIKDEGPVVFVWLYKYDNKTMIYILADRHSKEYIGHCTIHKLNPNIMQPVETFIIPEFRGFQLAPRLYSFISAINDITIINAPQLARDAEKMWLKIPHKKIYNLLQDKFYELSDPNAVSPTSDNGMPYDQEWFFSFKEERSGILESHSYLGEAFDYDRFLQNQPAMFLGGKWHTFGIKSPILV